MEIYNYNSEGYFVGASEAAESPLEEGVYLIPANATTIEPPVADKGFIQFFDGITWAVKPIPVEEKKSGSEEVPKNEIAVLTKENIQLKLSIAEIVEKQEKDKLEIQLALAELTESLSKGGNI
ncbi:hypothetical protein [Clostridium sp. HBUAS56017]|uniref:hypothetical protein n=1 Tax=Clostridium sp. HBUAS56017 TaxID=2571128 RepID=UPI001177338B|nr:hypothetical protein [Clostridium sp. HBUAS56017]